MGLLDEAIKEHLELKRRHGADPEDVARAEREALGPAVREVRESMTGASGPAAAEAPPAAEADGEQPPVAPAPGHEAEGEVAAATPGEAPPVAAEPPAIPDAPADQATQVFDAEDLFAEEPPGAVPDPEAPSPGAPPAEPAPDPDAIRPDPAAPAQAPPPGEAPGTAEGPGTAEAPAGDDVLEKTPDFLQETPEHDRLWFEQKPPKDFDFNE